MDVKLFIVLICFGLSSCSEPIEKLENDKTPKHIGGKKFYEQRCAICHGEDGKLGVSEAKDLSKSEMIDQQLKEIIKTGKGVMPPFGHTIESDSTLIELVEHIKTMRD